MAIHGGNYYPLAAGRGKGLVEEASAAQPSIQWGIGGDGEKFYPCGTIVENLDTASFSAVRASDGGLITCAVYGGWVPRVWSWTFDKAPYFHVDQLQRFYAGCMGTATTAPKDMILYPNMFELNLRLDSPEFAYVKMGKMNFSRIASARHRHVYWKGTAEFIEQSNPNSAVNRGPSQMMGGEPETEVVQ